MGKGKSADVSQGGGRGKFKAGARQRAIAAHNKAAQPVLDSQRRRRAKAQGTGADSMRTQGKAHSRRSTTANRTGR